MSSMNRFATCFTIALSAVLVLSLTADAQPNPRGQRSAKERDKPQTSRTTDRDRPAQVDSADRSAPQSFKVPEPNPQQQANLQDLRGSLSVMAGGAQAAEDEIRGLAQDLQGMSLQAPDPALTQALANDLAAAMADASLSPKEMAQLTQDIYAVLNSAGLSQSELEVLKDDVEAVLTASGVDRSDVQNVLDDLQAIYDASQGRSPSATSSKRGTGSRKLGRPKDGRLD